MILCAAGMFNSDDHFLLYSVEAYARIEYGVDITRVYSMGAANGPPFGGAKMKKKTRYNSEEKAFSENPSVEKLCNSAWSRQVCLICHTHVVGWH